jgi:ribonuclease R
MADRVGDEFSALIVNTTRYGFFVELEDYFVEGLVPVDSIPGDRFHYHENSRKIIGERTRRQFGIGDRVEVRLDRVDAVERKLTFSVILPLTGRKSRPGNARGR